MAVARAKVQWYGDGFIKDLRKENRIPLKKVGRVVEKSAKFLCPVGTIVRTGGRQAYDDRFPGKLRKSIKNFLFKTRRGRPDGVVIRAGDREVLYAYFVHQGTVNKRGRKRKGEGEERKKKKHTRSSYNKDRFNARSYCEK